jgi:hypothetical protein
MERKGTVGAFTKQANRAGMSVQNFAKHVLKHPGKFTEKTRKRAQFAVNMAKIGAERRARRLHNPGCACIACS